MKYIINGKFFTQKITGVQRYAREIINELDKITQQGEIIIAIPQKCNDIPSLDNIDVKRIGKLRGLLWEQIDLPLFAKKHNATIINLCNSAPYFRPDIVTIHDVKIKAHPEFFSKKFRVWYSILLKREITKSKKIITVSNFSKKELQKYYKIDNSKIVVIPNSWQHVNRIKYDYNALTKYGLQSKKYYFAMSSFDPNKNFKWIAEQALKNPSDIFAISGSINKHVFSNNSSFTFPQNIRLLGYVSDEEAKTLMKECKAFLFPSIYEGFGIPPLEAMAAGCSNIIVSDIEVMHEIFDEEVLYVNLNNLNYIFPTSKNSSHFKTLNRYSWKDSAKHLKKVLFTNRF